MAWRAYLLPILAPVAAAPFPAPVPAESGGAAPLPLDRIVEQAQAAAGGLPVRNVRLPGGDGSMVLIFLEDTTAGRPRAARRIWADGRSGEILADHGAATAPAGELLLDWMLPIHSGAVGGLTGRLLVLAAGLGLAGLAGTGLWLWQRKRSLRRKAASPRRAAR